MVEKMSSEQHTFKKRKNLIKKKKANKNGISIYFQNMRS